MNPLPPGQPTVTPHPIKEMLDRSRGLMLSSTAAATTLAQAALDAALAVPDGAPSLVAEARATLGLALHHSGRHAEGLAELNHALETVPEGDLPLRVEVLRRLSMGCELLGALEDSLAWATRALEVARRIGDPLRVADARLSLGVIQSRCGDAAGGLEHFTRVLPVYEAAGETGACVSVLNNMGINCKNLARYTDSAAHFERALVLSDASESPLGAGAVLRSNLGETLWLMGRNAAARETLVLAIAQLAQAGNNEGEINARLNHGRLLLSIDEAGPARAELEHVLRLSERSGSRNHGARAHLSLAELHKSAGRPDLALRHHEAYHAAERAQFNDESDRKLGTLRVQLEVADAQHEAQLHRLKHVEIAGAHEELKRLHTALLEADAEKNALLARLAEQTRTDALTGLANRRQLDEWLANEVARARRHGHPLAVAMCDLDFFKRINDRLGHATGDVVLRTVAGLLRERCRATDLVARYGGEEFCIAFPESDSAAAVRTCEALRDAVARHDWAALHPELTVTLSIGVSDDLSLASHERLLADADMHLYRAKRDGKNRVRWHGDSPV